MIELFSSTTVVRPMTRIRRERLLSQPGEIVARVGQEVSPVQVVARAAEETGFQILRASEILDVSAEDVPKYLLVQEGAAVQRGMPILRKPGFLGRGKPYKSPIDGVLYQVSNGNLVVQQTPTLIELRAMMQGQVAALIGGRGVALEATGSLIQAVWDSGREGFGKIKVVAASAHAPLRADQVDSDGRSAILVAGYLESIEPLEHAEEMGIRGFILGSMPADLCPAVMNFPFPLLLTEGIGLAMMAEPIFTLLQQSEGREASLFSRVSQRPGSRPEIIIPLPAAGLTEAPPGQAVALAVGQTVRLLRAPYSSLTGKVAALYDQGRPTASGLRLPGADVELSNGEVVSIPYTNLDVIL